LHSIIEQHLIDTVPQDDLEELDSVYTSSRYPVDIGILSNGKPTVEDATKLYEKAKMIYGIVLRTIK
jgi:hypothetical protein